MEGGEKVKKSIKIRLLPTEEQEVLMLKSSGCSRFAYNWALGREKENYKHGGKFISDTDLRKEFTKFKKRDRK